MGEGPKKFCILAISNQNPPIIAKLAYIVLSDVHLGEADSLLTPSEGDDYTVLHALSDALANLLEQFAQDTPPTLVLNGDTLGLAFSTHAESLQAFELFAQAFTKRNQLCSRVVYIPGNHDHHIWNVTVEEEYLRQLHQRTPGAPVPDPTYITGPTFEQGFESAFFGAFMDADSGIALRILYPNFQIPATDTGSTILFHHGHFAESTYHLVGQAMRAFYPDTPPPRSLDRLEAENGGWIDFAFSRLGRSGKAGERFTQLMATLSDKDKLDHQLQKLSHHLADNVDYPYLPFHWMERMLSRKLLRRASRHVRSERYNRDTVCSHDTLDSLLRYLHNYCAPQLPPACENPTLIWSHTHKPFNKIITTEQYDRLRVINTGGWVLPPHPTPVIGATLTLIDAQNECQPLRLYNDGPAGGDMQFCLTSFDDQRETAFAESINRCLRDEGGELRPVWADLRTALTREITKRREKHAQS